MIALTTITSVASNALVGTVTTKLVDSLLVSKFTQKQEKRKWIREKKLNLFSQLCEEVSTISCENLDTKRKNIKDISSKVLLLIEDKELKTNLTNYTFILDEYECFKSEIDLFSLNDELIDTLKAHIKKA